MEFITDLIVSIVMVATVLGIFVGVPLFIFVSGQRELALMTPAQRVVQRAEEQQWDDELHDDERYHADQRQQDDEWYDKRHGHDD